MWAPQMPPEGPPQPPPSPPSPPNLLVRSPSAETDKRNPSPAVKVCNDIDSMLELPTTPRLESSAIQSGPCMPAMPELVGMMKHFLPWNQDRNFSFGITLGDCGHGAAASSDQAMTGESCAFLLTVHGLNYSVLAENSQLWNACLKAVHDAVGSSDGTGLVPETVELMGGPRIVQVAVQLPADGACELAQTHGGPQTRLCVIAPNLCKTLAAKLMAVEGIKLATSGKESLRVVEPGTAMVFPEVVRFQGTWKKDDCGEYCIRDTVVCFPSGGRAELMPIGPYSFKITHPSGATFEAALEANGQELKWTNGSMWTRVDTPEVMDADEAGTALIGFRAGSSTQSLEGKEVSPLRWGATVGQCRELLRDLRTDPAWRAGNNVDVLIKDFLVPRTQGTGAGYALRENASSPKEANVLVVHARGRAANAEELLEAAILSAKSPHDVFWIDALSLYHTKSASSEKANDHACAAEVLERIGARAKSGRLSRRLFPVLLRALPVVLLALALLLFCGPVVAWGCMPDFDVSRCAVRMPVQDSDWSQGVEWRWYPNFERDAADLKPEQLDPVYPYQYAAALACAVIAGLVWALPLARPSLLWGGRVLVVMGTGDTATNLGEGAAAAVIDARRLRVPIVLAGGFSGARAAARKAEYTIELKAQEGMNLGIDVVQEGRALYVSSVVRGGLVEQWNERNPSLQVKAEDRLVEANGVRGDPSKINQVCSKAKDLRLTLRQAPTCRAGHPLRPLQAPEQGICDGCGCTVEPGCQVVDCSECKYFLCGACHQQAVGRRFGNKAQACNASRAEGSLRAVAKWRLASEAFAVMCWVVALWVLRTADIALALSQGQTYPWLWNTVAPFCAMGAFAGVAPVVLMTECASNSGALRLGVPAALGGATLLAVAGAGMVATLGLMGGFQSNLQMQQYHGTLELLGDEFLRHMDPELCNDLRCQRVVAFAASCGQTLLLGAASLALFACGSVCCPGAVRRRPWLGALLVGVALLAATALRMLCLWVADGGLPEREFWFAIPAFAFTQALARCGAPLLALLAAVSRRGVARKL
mmetsp:Transcript_18529/g.47633  ORF Transcript_18529/g.47633 Transcript_18529/m.47633 type:complete len:1048 (+) Transcript_18529:63-3206(+)